MTIEWPFGDDGQYVPLLMTVRSFRYVKGMEHVPNIFISFDKYLFLEVINILI